jgi:hypothetical protein
MRVYEQQFSLGLSWFSTKQTKRTQPHTPIHRLSTTLSIICHTKLFCSQEKLCCIERSTIEYDRLLKIEIQATRKVRCILFDLLLGE